MEKTEYITLEHFSNKHLDALTSFKLPEDQKQFTALPDQYKEVEDGQHRIVILNKTKPVGFFLLHATARVKDYSDNPSAMLLTSLSINHAEQGKGYAKKAMFLLKEFVVSEFPDCDEIVLAVNHKNISAQQLYLKVGFQDTGRRKVGPIGEQFIMNLML
ncbi:GNAT family N-acetyltransferase [Tenuibacillus multivorans]|uniref:Protein N-acetyltransferase, RimJ/RimL family n=1 Tax=Tenuibacillus multivorans TaxID=237069 RepID=A0A1G9YIY4_9BACI|nr:GNAT family N-acetyltransferase [Tenuibacillus multivorans]GEL78510.1 putative N-acetyltransferase YbbJ [Tenuibacillus multivorans]SDN08443.1 Protein N-acetyltransferase, RimJ/RimL family [Tenuibacillus multivorans]